MQPKNLFAVFVVALLGLTALAFVAAGDEVVGDMPKIDTKVDVQEDRTVIDATFEDDMGRIEIHAVDREGMENDELKFESKGDVKNLLDDVAEFFFNLDLPAQH